MNGSGFVNIESGVSDKAIRDSGSRTQNCEGRWRCLYVIKDSDHWENGHCTVQRISKGWCCTRLLINGGFYLEKKRLGEKHAFGCVILGKLDLNLRW